MLARARTRYPFYADVPPGGLDAFPVMTKSVMVERFADLNDRGLQLDRCLALARAAEADRDFTASADGVAIGLSSGTSGRQSVFLTSPRERSRWAGEILAKVLPQGLRVGARVALVLRAGGPLYESVGSGRVAFRFFDLARPAREHVPGMAAFAPTVLAAPPHVLRVLAQAHAAGIDLLARIGVLILLFEVGVESTVRQMLSVGFRALFAALLGVVAPFALGWSVSAWLLPDAGVYAHVFVGATLCATSVGITARVLRDLGMLQTREARIILGAAVLDDVLGLVVLAVVTGVIAAADAGPFIICVWPSQHATVVADPFQRTASVRRGRWWNGRRWRRQPRTPMSSFLRSTSSRSLVTSND